MTAYIQHNTIITCDCELNDGIAIEVVYDIDVDSDTYESHGMYTIDYVDIDVISADMIIVDNGRTVCRGEISEMEPIEIFLKSNISLL